MSDVKKTFVKKTFVKKTFAEKTAVLNLLKESGALLEGHFLLSSGRHSNRYFQCAKLFQYPDRAAAALENVTKEIKTGLEAGKLKIDLIVGPAMGGIIAAYELGRQLGLPAIFTERDDNGSMALRRGFEIERGQRILIAEDVVTTAKSSGECAKALEEKGAVIAGLACLVDRRSSGTEVPWPFFPAVAVSAENWEAENCELCKQGVPVYKPGSRKIQG